MPPGPAWFFILFCGFFVYAGGVYSYATVLSDVVHHGFFLCSGCCFYAEGSFLYARIVGSELRL